MRAFRGLSAFATAGIAVLLTTLSVNAAGIGDLSKVSAWVDHMPGSGGPNLHINGTIMAATPCFLADAKWLGEKRLVVKISVSTSPDPAKKGKLCPQIVSPIAFNFAQHYGGHATSAQVSSRVASVTVKIGSTQ